jgi:hypothetical protein
MSAEITKIIIKIGTVEVSMSPEEAKDLQRTLNNLLGETKYYPWYPPVYVPSVWTTGTTGGEAVLTCGSTQ